MSASTGKSSELYRACLLAIAQNKSRIRSAIGKTAVLYQGESRRGQIWREMQVRQESFMKKCGFDAPYELLTDMLRRESIPVRTDGGSKKLLSLMQPEDKRFLKGEVDDLWDALSHHWANNNNDIFLYVGSSKEPRTVFREVELPMLRLKAGKSAELLKQVEKATRALERNAPVEKEMIEIDKCLNNDFRSFARELQARHKAMARIPYTVDELDALYDSVNKLSRLSH